MLHLNKDIERYREGLPGNHENHSGKCGTFIYLKTKRTRRRDYKAIRNMQYMRLDLSTLKSKGEVRKMQDIVLSYLRIGECLHSFEHVTDEVN